MLILACAAIYLSWQYNTPKESTGWVADAADVEITGEEEVEFQEMVRWNVNIVCLEAQQR